MLSDEYDALLVRERALQESPRSPVRDAEVAKIRRRIRKIERFYDSVDDWAAYYVAAEEDFTSEFTTDD